MVQQENVLIEFTKWLLKWSAVLIGALIALCLSLIGGWWTWNWWSYERHKGHLEVATINSIAPPSDTKLVTEENGTPVYKLCEGGKLPIFVGFLNKSSRTVEYIEIAVSARLPDRSTNILSYDSRVKMDRIVKPKEGFGNCWQFSVDSEYRGEPDISKAIYSGKIEYVRFKEE